MRIPPKLEEEFLETSEMFRRGRRHLDITQDEVGKFLNVSAAKIASMELHGGQMLYRIAMRWMLEHQNEIPGRKLRGARAEAARRTEGL